MTGEKRFSVSDPLKQLIALNAPYWAAEAEVIRTYWHSPLRTDDTDRKWLTHQMYKEYWDGIYPPLEIFSKALPQVENTVSRQDLLKMSMMLHEEVEHYCLFANLYDKLIGSTGPKLTPDDLKRLGGWPENDALMKTRAAHKQLNPAIGQRAYHFTEGGYCALFAEGMKLKGRGGIDEAIARVCEHIYEDEFDHMLLGLINTDRHRLSDTDWALLGRMTVEQLQCRIRMRNAQFSLPVSPQRLEEMCAGKCVPITFDYERAQGHRVPA